MYSTVYSGGINGLHAFIAKVEVDISRGLPSFDMVGKLSKEVTEAKERVRVALRNSEIDLPAQRITINISPANIRKSGTGYDLPIATAILVALGIASQDIVDKLCIIGELGLDGHIAPVQGILPIVNVAQKSGFSICIVPMANATEASYVKDIHIIGVNNFSELISSITNITNAQYVDNRNLDNLLSTYEGAEDFEDVVAQDSCKRAALIAAAGFHHLLITGPPGSGKTMIAKRLRTILPPLTSSESLEVSSIYSVAGKLNEKTPIILQRPFQSPHHAATTSSLTGGGSTIRPGIVSLSHKGILFLDELPEFSKDCIEVLREPLESKCIHISRVSGLYSYPADFLLVGAANPCPCGYYPDRNRCTCTETEIRRYQNKISGPIRDRIDLIVTSEKIELSHLSSNNAGIDSHSMRQMVTNAWNIQQNRFQSSPYQFNSQITAKDINQYCPISSDAHNYMEQAFSSLNLSARSYHKILKVARTIADLESSKNIQISHLAEAICYRG